jgi:type II secretory pathway component PulJ
MPNRQKQGVHGRRNSGFTLIEWLTALASRHSDLCRS